MDRSSRRSSIRRLPHASSASPPPSSGDLALGRRSPVSPVLKSHSWHQNSQNINHQAGTNQPRRISRASSNHELTMSTPDGRRDSLPRRRSRASDDFADTAAAVATPAGADAEDGPTKGGHSLRRRTRVNYASEQLEGEVTVPNSTSSSAARQRRQTQSVQGDSPEDFYGTRPRRQEHSSGLDAPSGRRRNPSRKSAEARPYFGDLDHGGQAVEDPVQDGEDEIHDSIQVGSWSTTLSSPSSKSESAANWQQSPAQAQGEETSSLDARLDGSHQGDAAAPKAGDTSANSGTHTAQLTSREQDDSLKEPSAGPSQQLQVESIESQQAEADKASGPAPSPVPADSSMSRRSPGSGSRSPRHAANHSQDQITNNHSPEIVQGASLHVNPSNNNTDMEADDPGHEPSAPASSESMPVAMDIVDEAKDDAAESAPPEESAAPSEAPSQPPRAADSLIDKTHTHRDEAKDTPTPPPREEDPTPNDKSPAPSPTKDSRASSLGSLSQSPAPEAPDTRKLTNEPVASTPLKEELATDQPGPVPDPRWCRPQPVPEGRWSYLTPYVDGEYSVYPERQPRSDEDDASEDQSPEDKDSVKDGNDADAPAEDNEDSAEPTATEFPTPALNTPTRGSPVPEAIELAALNSPAPAVDEPEDADDSDTQEPIERKKHYRYRKLRDPDEFAAAIENYEDMSTEELYDALQAINLSLTGWQEEWSELGRIVDDCENASRRRIADAKYETRTRNLQQHGVNYEEPDFAVRGYKAAKERENMSETRYLQSQDRIMAAAYGFEYDPHPSKIGRQNPETQQAGVTTRGRSLRNQPRQTAKATENDVGVTGKRQRKPVQLFDPAPPEASRPSSPAPGRGRRRRNAAQDGEDAQASFASSFNDNSDGEGAGPGRRRRTGRQRMPRATDDYLPSGSQASAAPEETPRSSGRRGRPRAVPKYEEQWSPQNAADPEAKQHKRHLLTLKIPKQRKLSDPSSGITDNGDSRPSTASSDSTTETVESSYSFRPKRQKRFRDEPEETEGAVQAPPRKRNRRSGPVADGDDVMKVGASAKSTAAAKAGAAAATTPSSASNQKNGSVRKTPKIKLVRPPPGASPASRNGTPMSQPTTDGGDEQPKEYRAMTKSEKMSASMKNRWANGNMAGAVEKRKATLAAKKAAQAANEQRVGPIAPKPKSKPGKKEVAPLPGENPAFIHARPPPPAPPQHPHHHHQHHQHHHPAHQHPHHHHPHMHLQPQVAPHPGHPHHQPHAHPHQQYPRHDYPGMGAPFPTS